MKNKRFYQLLMIIFLIFIFGSNIDNFLISINPKMNEKILLNEYQSTLKSNYEELLNYHNLSINTNPNIIISKVKFRNIYSFKDEIVIYKGFKDKVGVGDAVVNSDGLVGVVKKTFEHDSIVELLTNKNSEISVKINDAYGILTYDGKVIVNSLNVSENISVGDKIYTSGIGNLPGNILVGEVAKINLNNNKIEKVIEVSLKADLNKINYLYIYGDYNA